MSKRKYVFLSRWDKYNLKCACLFHNPCCDRYTTCEEIELELNPWDDIETVMHERRYTRGKGGALKQR